LNELYEVRQEACQNLEAAISSVLRDATKRWRAKQKAGAKARKARQKHGIKDEEDPNGDDDQQKLVLPPPNELLEELVPTNQRPTHRTGVLGIIGTKVESITWYKVGVLVHPSSAPVSKSKQNEIARLNKEIKEAREHIIKGKFLGSAFVRCNLQMGAHVLAQCVSYHEVNHSMLYPSLLLIIPQPLTMYDKWMEANPRDIVWANLDDGAVEMGARKVLSWAATIGLIFLWSFPSAFIGTLSNLDSLCERVG
jgi:hypothetical protein